MKRVDIFSKKYYTDWHDVDEDLRTIAIQGGAWTDISYAGITHRDPWNSPSAISGDVASLKNKNSLSRY